MLETAETLGDRLPHVGMIFSDIALQQQTGSMAASSVWSRGAGSFERIACDIRTDAVVVKQETRNCDYQ